MNTIKQVRDEAAQLVADAVSKRVDTLRKTKGFKDLEWFLNGFAADHGEYSFDEYGELISSKPIPLDSFEDEDSEVIEALLAQACEFLSYRFVEDQWVVSQNHGEPVIVDFNADRNQYAIHSTYLKLKIHRIESERHAQLIIEQAMRKHGYYPDVVVTDYYGRYVKHLSFDDVPKLSDAEIEAELEKIEGTES